MCFYRKTRCGGGIGSLNFCREQQAVDPRGSERRVNKHPTVVPASRHTVVLPVWERGSMWYVVTSHTQTLKALKCVKSCLQARLVKTVNIRKPCKGLRTRPSVQSMGNHCVGSLSTGSPIGCPLNEGDSSMYSQAIVSQKCGKQCMFPKGELMGAKSP